jgi:hypothetical protein
MSRRDRHRALAWCGVVMLLVGWGSAGARSLAHVRVEIDLVTTIRKNDGAISRHDREVVLTCHPTGGTLPYAARVCGDIDAHPVAMLHPATPRSHCPGELPARGPVTTIVGLVTTVDGVATRAQPTSLGCPWPGGARLGVFQAAAERDAKDLATAERRLRCDEPPFLGPHAPDVSVCQSDGIRLAEQAPPLAALNAAPLFPRDTGSRPCAIETGGAVKRELQGVCTVSTRSGSLIFVERWTWDNLRWSHTWWFQLNGGPALLLTDYGAVPPQLWR